MKDKPFPTLFTEFFLQIKKCTIEHYADIEFVSTPTFSPKQAFGKTTPPPKSCHQVESEGGGPNSTPHPETHAGSRACPTSRTRSARRTSPSSPSTAAWSLTSSASVWQRWNLWSQTPVAYRGESIFFYQVNYGCGGLLINRCPPEVHCPCLVLNRIESPPRPPKQRSK